MAEGVQISNSGAGDFTDKEWLIPDRNSNSSDSGMITPRTRSDSTPSLRQSSSDSWIGSPGPGPMSPEESSNLVHNLPKELLQAGWRRFWSQREGREYFYNKVTKESKWEMPGIMPQFDLLSDPLGFNLPPMVNIFSDPSATQTTLKRGRSQEDSHQPKKRLVYSPFWDFDIPSNAVVIETKVNNFLPPTPEIEQLRFQMVGKLRQNYRDLCMSREGIESPFESFNRWLLERRVVANGDDPLLPSNCRGGAVSMAMLREIMNDIPVKLVKPSFCNDARRQLFKYAEAAKKLIENRGTSHESRKLVKWYADDTFAFLQRRQDKAMFEDYVERLAHLKRECQPYVIEAAQSSVEGICTKIYTHSCEYAKKIRERHVQLYEEAKIEILPVETSIPNHRSRPSSAATTLNKTLPSFPVEHSEKEGIITLKYKGDALTLNSDHFKKLEQLYQLNCKDDAGMEQYLNRTWCLLKRYQSFFGMQANEGFGLQGALPTNVFKCLNRLFDVSFECFASPLNSYFKQYCSAFADTDGYFGSSGPILDMHMVSGSYEANPPFNEELMEAMVDHFEALLSESSEPLSFIIFIPDWKDPPTEAMVRLESSRFKRKQVTVAALEHEYRHGFQHICSKKDINVVSGHGTMIVFLQNDAGLLKWLPTQEKIKELVLAYRPIPSK